ncbi:TPA_asm: hypothetical protein GFY42_15345, partial [Listeria monocytogenes]|nr:hypothetical protein [Listeria monocytogenes]
MKNIKDVIRCAVACFSAQFVLDDIGKLTSLGIPFLGSYYSYDTIAVGDSIINYGSIKMTRISEDEATVKWGKDKAYKEPAIEDSVIPF